MLQLKIKGIMKINMSNLYLTAASPPTWWQNLVKFAQAQEEYHTTFASSFKEWEMRKTKHFDKINAVLADYDAKLIVKQTKPKRIVFKTQEFRTLFLLKFS